MLHQIWVVLVYRLDSIGWDAPNKLIVFHSNQISFSYWLSNLEHLQRVYHSLSLVHMSKD